MTCRDFCSQANRPVDVGQQYDLLRLQTQAFEAINEMVRSASSDTVPLVGHLIPVVLQKLATTMGAATSTSSDGPGDLQVLYKPLFHSPNPDPRGNEAPLFLAMRIMYCLL
jgi:hypothetical protein